MKVTKRVATGAAGDNGAISVWIDDKGCYRGDMSRHMRTRSSVISETKRGLRMWLKENWEQMHF